MLGDQRFHHRRVPVASLADGCNLGVVWSVAGIQGGDDPVGRRDQVGEGDRRQVERPLQVDKLAYRRHPDRFVTLDERAVNQNDLVEAVLDGGGVGGAARCCVLHQADQVRRQGSLTEAIAQDVDALLLPSEGTGGDQGGENGKNRNEHQGKHVATGGPIRNVGWRRRWSRWHNSSVFGHGSSASCNCYRHDTGAIE